MISVLSTHPKVLVLIYMGPLHVHIGTIILISKADWTGPNPGIWNSNHRPKYLSYHLLLPKYIIKITVDWKWTPSDTQMWDEGITSNV